MKQIFFEKGSWENEGLVYAYSWRFGDLPKFVQEEDHIRNSPKSDPPQPYDYDYMGLVFPDIHTDGVKCSVRCSFEGLGAPMLLIADRNEVDENGVFRTLDYYELVMYKGGLNVWRMHTKDRQVTWYDALRASFPVTENEIHTLSVEIKDSHLVMQVDDTKLQLYVHDLGDSFQIGYTACEGTCRLYDMTLEEAADAKA